MTSPDERPASSGNHSASPDERIYILLRAVILTRGMARRSFSLVRPFKSRTNPQNVTKCYSRAVILARENKVTFVWNIILSLMRNGYRAQQNTSCRGETARKSSSMTTVYNSNTACCPENVTRHHIRASLHAKGDSARGIT